MATYVDEDAPEEQSSYSNVLATNSLSSLFASSTATTTTTTSSNSSTSASTSTSTTNTSNRRVRPVVALTAGLLTCYKQINEMYYTTQQQQQQQQQQRQPLQQKATHRRKVQDSFESSPSSSSASGSTVPSLPAPVAPSDAPQACDDENGNYRVVIGEVWDNRYEVLQLLGKGSFGQVVKVLDRVRNEQLAIKIIKNKKSFFNQAQIEIRLLEHMASVDVVERAFIIEYRRQFLYCNHLCLEFELLSFNLYDLLKNTGFQGVSLNLVRKFGTQLLQALAFLSSPAINIIHCFPEDDHQLLTNRGFMFLDEVEAHVAFAADGETVVDWRGLEVASYDEKSGRLVYQQPLRLVVNRDTSAPVELFEFTDAAEAARWSADAELPATKSALMTSVTCTGEHSLYVRTNDDVAFRKRTAESLAQRSNGAIQLLAAVGGDAAVSCDSLYGGDMSLSFIASLELTREQVTPFVELFGMWLGDCGSLQRGCSFVLQSSSDIAFVDSRLRACGLRDDEVVRSSTRNECVEIYVLRSSWIALFDACRHASDKRFLPWVWQLDAASLRRLIAGLHGSGGGDACCIHVTSVNFRDELVRVLLHAGFSATFEASRCVGRVGVGWRVMYSADERVTKPVLRLGGDVVRKHSRHVRTWCFTTSAGFVVVRRAQRALAGDRAVLKASRATIQSNCDLKPENILLRSPKRSAIKVIDFGSSCYLTQRMYTYIQSRFYRAPEVVLDRGYGCAIDMWSLGAILVELHTGEPLFPGRSEVDLMLHMVEVLDMPPDWYIESSPKHQKFFTFRQFELNGPKYRLRQMRSAQGAAFARRPLAIALAAPRRRRANENGHAGADYARFSEAVLGMLTYDPAQRVVPHQALQHPFFAAATSVQNE